MSETTTDRPGGTARRRTGHEEAWDLLPWYVNGTLDEEELRGVEEHLELCGICREEVRYWRECSRLLAEEDEVALSPDAGLARLRERTSGSPRRAPAGRRRALAPRRWLAGFRTTPRPARWAMAAQMAAIALLAGWLAATRPATSAPAETAAQDTAPADGARGAYRTLADPAPQAVPAEGLLRVVFGGETREREIRGALIAVGGRIVAGPSPTGVYTVRVETAAVGEVVETLRSFPQIVLAERAAALGDGS
ncbi:MAG: zf-HC2 domain-containing protein [Thermoanaerobaculia bacterium]